MKLEKLEWMPRKTIRCSAIAQTMAEYHLRQNSSTVNVVTVPRCKLAAAYRLNGTCYCRQHTGNVLIDMALKGELVEVGK